MKNIKKTVFIVFFSIISFTAGYAQVPAADSLALVKLYDSTGGDSWSNNTNWKTSSNVGDWLGVTVRNGRVTQLDLHYNNLTGTLPSQLGDLTALERLELVNNHLSGSIPASVGNLVNLYYLSMGWNDFPETSFPAEMGNLTNLEYLYLPADNLTAFPPFIFNLSSLKSLALGYNQIPLIPTNIENLTNLETLDMASNQLGGKVPSQLGVLSNLTYLNLGGNGFSVIPATITDLTGLQSLLMWGNSLDEADVTNIGNLVNLTMLQINNNLFTIIPSEIAALPSLKTLHISSNQISDSGLGSLSGMTNLETLGLNGNALTEFPAAVLGMPKMGYLDLSYNQIDGPIPSAITSLSSLYFLYLNNNHFSGDVPAALADLPDLVRLDVSQNELVELPSFHVANGFQTLKIDNNYFTFEDIEPNLVFDNSVFTYAPQKEVGSGMDTVLTLGSSITLNVPVGGSHNQYQWYHNDLLFPNATGSSLEVHLNGPVDFGSYKLKITNTEAQELELWSKPFNLEQDNLLEQDSLALVAMFNALDGPNWSNHNGWLMGPLSTWYGLVIMDDRVTQLLLDNNNLRGELPSEIGNLTALNYLKLDNNTISGAVPQEIVNMSALTDLHLQYNDIDYIPDLHGLNNLLSLMVEGNHLIFDNLKPNIGVASVNFSYAPQDSLDIGDERVYRLGNKIFLKSPTPNPDNKYFWFKNGKSVGGNQNPLEIFSIEYSDAGLYTCTVTNSFLPDLSLHLRPVNVRVVSEPVVYYQTDVPTAPKTAQINFQVNPGGLPTSVEIQYGKTSAYGQVRPYNQGALQGIQFIDLSMLIPGLEPNTSYQYKIVAQNDSGTVFRDGLSFRTKSYPASYSVNEHFDLPARSKKSDYNATDYRLFGLPGTSDMPVENIFSGTAGEDWIAYLDNGNSSNYYQKFGSIDDFYFNQGRAFWVLSLHGADIDQSINTVQLNDFSEAEIGLHEGWNLITNPFDQSVSWSAIADVNNLSNYELFGFDGSFTSPQNLNPFEGYLFRPPSGMTTLFIPIPGGFTAKSFGKQGITKNDRTDWELNLVLESDGFRDATTHLGVRSDVSEEQIQNYKKPRAMGNILNIWFEHPEWDENEPAYVTDFRSIDSENHTWEINTNLFPGKKASLSVLNLEQLPQDQQVYLFHKKEGRYWNLREANTVSFVPQTQLNTFEIVVGESDLVKNILEKIAPTEFVLEQNYPNPFNPATVISYQLPAANFVKLTVYNALGQKVQTLAEGMQDAGRHTVTFNSNGLSSGIYYYRITTATFTKTRKMILMR